MQSNRVALRFIPLRSLSQTSQITPLRKQISDCHSKKLTRQEKHPPSDILIAKNNIHRRD